METFVTDTIVCDSTLLDNFSTDSGYDYNRDVQAESKSILEKIYESIADWFRDLFDSAPEVDPPHSSEWGALHYILIAVLVIAVLVLLYVMYKKKLFIFKRREKNDEEDYEVVEDTIYGIDFDNDIEIAYKAGNYKEAVRLSYLQCLRMLSDKALIDWRIYKTPTQYTEEYKDDVFAQFTRRYVFIRYGGYDVDITNFGEMSRLKKEIERRVADLTSPPAMQQEGGGNED